jgi:hypothetical protein
MPRPQANVKRRKFSARSHCEIRQDSWCNPRAIDPPNNGALREKASPFIVYSDRSVRTAQSTDAGSQPRRLRGGTADRGITQNPDVRAVTGPVARKL